MIHNLDKESSLIEEFKKNIHKNFLMMNPCSIHSKKECDTCHDVIIDPKGGH